ncbi:hypothetical protein HK098_007229 [Nowakowskiella sp. JEL0407]|nr:hypothetical protein HK098_007229 [Nowakowskiella sp. JEL0407]
MNEKTNQKNQIHPSKLCISNDVEGSVQSRGKSWFGAANGSVLPPITRKVDTNTEAGKVQDVDADTNGFTSMDGDESVANAMFFETVDKIFREQQKKLIEIKKLLQRRCSSAGIFSGRIESKNRDDSVERSSKSAHDLYDTVDRESKDEEKVIIKFIEIDKIELINDIQQYLTREQDLNNDQKQILTQHVDFLFSFVINK